MKPARILLVHLSANGDCLMVTTIARQIKNDYPGCHLTWAIGYKCRQVIDNNSDVDEVWEVRYGSQESPLGDVWHRVRREAEERYVRGEFDFVFYTQVYPDNVSNFDGTTRSSTFRCYPHPITVPMSPVMSLRDQEVEHVRLFAAGKELSRYRSVILLECAPGSGQSVLDLTKGIVLAEKIVSTHEDAVVVVSTHMPFTSPHPRIIDGSCLSFRENAALSHFCSLLVGCSSGITWLLTSGAAKSLLPTVQFLSRRAVAGGFASVVHDFDYWGIPSGHVLESDADNVEDMAFVITCALADFPSARVRHHKVFKPPFWGFLFFFDFHSLRGMTRFPCTFMLFMRRNRYTWRDVCQLWSLWRFIGDVVRKGPLSLSKIFRRRTSSTSA
jgi:hypothetical protein